MSSEEVQAIESIYCGDGEFEIYEKGNNGITSFALQLISECAPKRLVFKIVVSLPPTYPDKLPDVCIHSTDLTRQQQAHLHAALMSYLHEQMGEPMLLEMALWLQDNAVTYCEDPEPPSQRSLTDTSADHQLTLLHLDHMRARTQYIKTIERWTSELGLSGRLVFLDSLILLLLEGRPQAIKEYLLQARSVSVDVDSRGRSCKERMLSQLVTVDLKEGHNRFSDFSVVECSSRDDLVRIFKDNDLMDLYESYVHKSLLR